MLGIVGSFGRLDFDNQVQIAEFVGQDQDSHAAASTIVPYSLASTHHASFTAILLELASSNFIIAACSACSDSAAQPFLASEQANSANWAVYFAAGTHSFITVKHIEPGSFAVGEAASFPVAGIVL